jgi:2'-5' RNA ligase
MKAKGYSLWLMPTGEVYDKFSGLIRRLAEEYRAPLFAPHITLLGETRQSEEDVLRKAKQLASIQKPFPVTLNTVDYQDFYFRTLFVRADRTNSLQALHDRAKEIFEMQDIPYYMPHLSLLYGNFPKTVKEQIIKSIGRDQATEFTVKGIDVFKTDGEEKTWHRVKQENFLLE